MYHLPKALVLTAFLTILSCQTTDAQFSKTLSSFTTTFATPKVSLSRGRLNIEGTSTSGNVIVSLDRGTSRSAVDDEFVVKMTDVKTKSSQSLKFPRYMRNSSGYYSRNVLSLRFSGHAGSDYFENRTYLPSLGYGGTGFDVLIGGTGIDEFHGDEDEDVIEGNGGNDKLFGGTGDDWVSGGTGKDILIGHTGDDNYVHDISNIFKDTFQDDFDFNQPIVEGASVLDIQQTGSSICSLMASLAGVAEKSNATITNGIEYLGAYQYRVRLFNRWSGEPFWQEVYFDGTWKSGDAEPSRERNADGISMGRMTGDFWTTLYMRAYLDALQINREDHPQDWVKGSPAWARAYRSAAMFTGWTESENKYFRTSYGYNDISLFWDVYMGTLNGDILSTGGTGHVVAILDLYWEGAWKIRLYDPRARDSNQNFTSGLREPESGLNDGEYVMTWENFVEAFVYLPYRPSGMYLSHAKRP